MLGLISHLGIVDNSGIHKAMQLSFQHTNFIFFDCIPVVGSWNHGYL